MATYNAGDQLTIEAHVLHAVDLGGGVTNYCMELPSGHTAWLRSYQLPAPPEDEPETRAVPEPEETKHVGSPPARKGRARR